MSLDDLKASAVEWRLRGIDPRPRESSARPVGSTKKFTVLRRKSLTLARKFVRWRKANGDKATVQNLFKESPPTLSRVNCIRAQFVFHSISTGRLDYQRPDDHASKFRNGNSFIQRQGARHWRPDEP